MAHAGIWKRLFERKPFFEAPPAGPAVPVEPVLSWIDECIRRIRPFIAVRSEDNLLIKLPNEVHKLNQPAVELLKDLLSGQSISSIARRRRWSVRQRREVIAFFCALERFMKGEPTAGLCPGTEVESFRLGVAALPVLSEIALTYRCNLKCAFCYAGCGPSRVSTELSTGDVKRILRALFCEAKVPSVSFTGGEPALRSDLCELVRYAKETGFRVNLITNGTLIDRKLAVRLRESGLDSAQVSLEGVEAGTHDGLTGVEGSFERCLQGIRNLKAAGVEVHTNTTAVRRNLQELIRLPRFVKETLGNDRFSLNMLIPAGAAARRRDLFVYYSEIGRHVERILREAERWGVRFLWYSPTPLCLFNPIALGLGNKGCSACDGLISVAPNGDVLPCSSWAEPVGNLLRQEVLSVWRSAKAVSYRRKEFAPRACRSCEHFAVCQGACPLYFQSVGMEELHGRGEAFSFAGLPAGS